MADDKNKLLPHRLVHLDLKGAPLCVDYLEKVFPLLKRWGTTGLLVEYEDSFPYSEELKVLAAPHAYSKEEIKQIQTLAADNDLIIIPLVQTFGHLEFVLKHEEFFPLREVEKYPMALCPSNPDALSVVCKMIDQVMALHSGVQHFHIGCDEVYHLGLCKTCKSRMADGSLSKEQIFFSHVREVATHVQKNYNGVMCIVWDDMFRFSELPVILNCRLGGLVEPMIWHYVPAFMLPNDLWENLSAIFPKIWIASAFKGATGPRAAITNIRYHLDNHHAWLETLRSMSQKFKAIQGIAITGWQRYDHYAVLCELFPHGLPCLALCLRFVEQGTLSPTDVEFVGKELEFTTPLPINPFASRDVPACDFPGSLVYQMTIEFVHAEATINEFFALEGIASWMHEYNMERKFINPVHVEPLLARAESLLESLHGTQRKISPAFTGVFVSGVEQEWKGLFVQPLVKRLEDFIEKAKTFLAPPAITNQVENNT
ncbi:hexosaminidase D [Aplysia californica]|uniref:beta-N-acetylhexosaminidase n=1 Tax=Aplysia californica TaxID=6500 RepID=A0ABM0JL84_APLCA|nr:hexosaminidase D [Aplysia californica]